MAVDAGRVKALRDKTGAGMMDCKNALVEAGGDETKAIGLLREKGLAAAAKRSGRITAQGLVEAYIHPGGKIGVMVEVNCETDFVARNEQFRTFVRDLCLQVAATDPRYLQRESVPDAVLEQERSVLWNQAVKEGKPEKIAGKIVEGRLEKFYRDHCLLEQAFVKDPDLQVKTLLANLQTQIGENIVIRRFVRFGMGEGIENGTSCS